MNRIEFLNYPVDSVSISEALDWMADCISHRRSHTITAINANKLWQMSKDARLANFVRCSDLVIPEWAVVWGAKRVGTPLKAHVGGVSLLKASLPWAEERGYRLYFLGARSNVIQMLVDKLQRNYPRLKLAGWHHGYLSNQADHQQVRSLIQESQPDLLFVAMGTPMQEYWIEDNLHHLGVPVVMGVGGSFDVISGLKRDTPDWARGNGLEWLYRLAQEPKTYWRRYLITNAWFVWQVARARFEKCARPDEGVSH